MANDIIALPDAGTAPNVQAAPIRFDELLGLVIQTVASPATADAYAADLDDWRVWCDDFGEDATLPTFRTVSSSLPQQYCKKRDKVFEEHSA